MTTIRQKTCAFALATLIALPATAQARSVHHHRPYHGHHRERPLRLHPHGHHGHDRHYARFGAHPGFGSDPISIAMRYLGSGNITGKSGPWCGHFVNLIEHQRGHRGVSSGMATAWTRYGRPTGPVRGAIAVFRGHVAYVVDRVGDKIETVYGNWGHRVGLGWVKVRSAIAFRMP